MEPGKKSKYVRELVAGGNYKEALRIVKGFRLGISKEDSSKMCEAYECMVHPDFYRQLHKDTDQLIADGISVLNNLYGIGGRMNGKRKDMDKQVP